MASFHGQHASNPGATIHLTCDIIIFFLMRNEHGFPTAGIHAFPQKLGNTASFEVQQQNSVGVYVGGEREERAEWEASERNIHFSLCFWLLSCSWKEEGMELGFLLRRGTDASCSPKTVQRGWQLFQLSCYVFVRQQNSIANSVEVGLETTLKPAVTFMSCFGVSRQLNPHMFVSSPEALWKQASALWVSSQTTV